MTHTTLSIPTDELTEATSIAMAQAIQHSSIQTPLQTEPIATSFVVQGQGDPPILLLHGFDSSVLEFRRLLPLLAQRTQTWAVDLLGFGFTARPDGLDISPSRIKQHLYDFWQQRLQRPMVLVGASMGGAAALDFALSFPEAVSKLVLLDSAGYRGGPAVGKFLIPPLGYWATEGFLRKPQVRQKISEKAYRDPQWASRDAQRCAALHLDQPNWAKALISFTQSGGYPCLRSQLGRLDRPTLILWGESDRILGTKDAEGFHRAIPHSQLVWVPECGHVPHLEKPEFVSEAIAQFAASAKKF